MRTADTTNIDYDIKRLFTSLLNSVNQRIKELEQYEGDLKNYEQVSFHTEKDGEIIYFTTVKDEKLNFAHLYFTYDEDSILFRKLDKN